MNKSLVTLLIGAGALLGTMGAAAQDASAYPSKPIRIINPYNAGGQGDAVMRPIGAKLTERWGQPVVIENRPGAGGNIGAEFVARAAPDGYTLLVAEGTLLTVNRTLFKNLVAWDPVKDFAPITRVSFFASVLAVHPSVPVNSVAGFIALAKSKPGSLTYGTAIIGSIGHVGMEAFKLQQGLDLVPVHYKGSASMQVDLTAGRISSTFLSVFSSAPMAKNGKWKVLGYAWKERSPFLPDVPTFAEQGFPGFEISSWFCMMAPAGTPHAIIGKIQQEVARIISEPAFKERWYTSRGLEPVTDTPEELAALIRVEIEKWARVIKAAGITPD